jgi:hypothetical protein
MRRRWDTIRMASDGMPVVSEAVCIRRDFICRGLDNMPMVPAPRRGRRDSTRMVLETSEWSRRPGE